MTSWDEFPQFLTVTEAAQIARVGRAQMYELTRTPDFPAIRIGKIIRIPRESFRDWLLEQSRKS